MALLGRFTLIWLPSLLTLKVPETAWLLALTGRVNKTLVFFTHLFCSKNELSVRSRTVGPQTPGWPANAEAFEEYARARDVKLLGVPWAFLRQYTVTKYCSLKFKALAIPTPNIRGYWIWNVRKTSEVSLSYYSTIRQRFPHMKTPFLGMNIPLACLWTKNKWFPSGRNRLAGVIAEIPTEPLSAQPARYHCDDCPSVSVPVPGGLVLCHWCSPRSGF